MITVQDLIRRKTEKKNKEKDIIEVFVKELEGNIKVEIPSPQDMAEIVENSTEEEQPETIIYNCVTEPRLNDELLIQSYDCKTNPKKIVTKIMGKESMYQLAKLITDKSNEKMADYAIEVVTAAKN